MQLGGRVPVSLVLLEVQQWQAKALLLHPRLNLRLQQLQQRQHLRHTHPFSPPPAIPLQGPFPTSRTPSHNSSSRGQQPCLLILGALNKQEPHGQTAGLGLLHVLLELECHLRSLAGLLKVGGWASVCVF